MHTNYPRYNIVTKLFPLFLKNQIYTVISEKEINIFSKTSKKEKIAWYPGTSPCRDVVIFKVPKIIDKIHRF